MTQSHNDNDFSWQIWVVITDLVFHIFLTTKISKSTLFQLQILKIIYIFEKKKKKQHMGEERRVLLPIIIVLRPQMKLILRERNIKEREWGSVF